MRGVVPLYRSPAPLVTPRDIVPMSSFAQPPRYNEATQREPGFFAMHNCRLTSLPSTRQISGSRESLPNRRASARDSDDHAARIPAEAFQKTVLVVRDAARRVRRVEWAAALPRAAAAFSSIKSAPRRNRTFNLVIKSHLLCQLS